MISKLVSNAIDAGTQFLETIDTFLREARLTDHQEKKQPRDWQEENQQQPGCRRKPPAKWDYQQRADTDHPFDDVVERFPAERGECHVRWLGDERFSFQPLNARKRVVWIGPRCMGICADPLDG